MLIKAQKLNILAAYYASRGDADVDDRFAALVLTAREQGYEAELRRTFIDLDSLVLARAMKRTLAQSTIQRANIFEQVSEDGDTVLFGEEHIGKIVELYCTAFPQESQVQIAYRSLLERFYGFLRRQCHIAVLSENAFSIQLFMPEGKSLELSDLWREFTCGKQGAFSAGEIEKSFLLLVNSIKLTSRGFGYVEFPPVTRDMAEMQAAFYLATLHQRLGKRYSDAVKKLQDTQEKLTKQRNTLAEPNLSERRRFNAQQKIVELEEELEIQQENARTAMQERQQVWEQVTAELAADMPTDVFERISRLMRRFNTTGRTQFSYGTVKPKLGKKTGGKSIEDMIIKLASSSEMFELPCLFAETSLYDDTNVHSAGDDERDICYSCGRIIPEAEKGYSANRFILADPSQRLQSGGGQVQPSVCYRCAAIAFACPIKLTDESVVVRLSKSDEQAMEIGLEDYLRMLTLGEMNIVAGKYLLIACREQVYDSEGKKKPMSSAMGGFQYALYKIAITLPREVLQHRKTWLVASGREIPLPPRYLVWLNYLQEIFRPRLVVSNKSNTALMSVVRLVQKEAVLSAVYSFIRAGKEEARQLSERSFMEKQLIEELRESHCNLLEKEGKSEMSQELQKRAQLFRDVAAFTGIIYPFCRYVEQEAQKYDKNVKNEVTKLIEEVTDPYQFLYRATHNLDRPSATMRRTRDNYFCFDCAREMLENLGVDLADRESVDEEDRRSLRMYFDDISNAYTTLFARSEYVSEKEQKRFTTELKLSLCAKFPQYFVKKGADG